MTIRCRNCEDRRASLASTPTDNLKFPLTFLRAHRMFCDCVYWLETNASVTSAKFVQGFGQFRSSSPDMMAIGSTRFDPGYVCLYPHVSTAAL